MKRMSVINSVNYFITDITMRGITLMLLLAMLPPLSVKAQGVQSIAEALERLGSYSCTVDYQVTMPAFSEPVVYSVNLTQQPSVPGDTLAACDYLVDWTLQRDTEPVTGWSAYHNGHHYRLLSNRLQEYHVDANPMAFGIDNNYAIKGGTKSGVQSNAQFTDLLPAFIARSIRDNSIDSTYHFTLHSDTIISGIHRTALYALQRYKGYDVRRWLLVLDRENGNPVRITIDNNPGSISEQSITAIYTPRKYQHIDLTEAGLIARYPTDFEQYRQSTYRIENLAGTPLPSFSAKLTDGQRYTYTRKSRLPHPTVIVLLNRDQGDPATTSRLIRQGVDTLPGTIDVVWAFMDEAHPDVTPLPGELLLTGIRSLARDCGVHDTPVTILVDSSGMVRDVIIGFNNSLSSDVTQKASLLN